MIERRNFAMHKMFAAIAFFPIISACVTPASPNAQEPPNQVCGAEVKVGECFQGRALEAKGIIWEKEFALLFETPKNWVLDTETLRNEHIPMWFPASSKKPMGECFIYFRFDKADSVDELVKKNLALMKTRPEGDPDLEATEVSKGTTLDGRPIRTFAYTKRRDGRQEMVSYIPDKTFVQFLVLSCPDVSSLQARKSDLDFMITRLRRM